MDVINFEQVQPALCSSQLIVDEGGVCRYRLCYNRYFVTERIEMKPRTQFKGHCDGRSLEIWGVLTGEVTINGISLTSVRFTLLPATLGDFTVTTHDTPTTLLRTYVDS